MTPPPGSALAGFVVAEVDGGEAGAIAGMILAENGASVIKIEPPEGAAERWRSGSDAWDRGKGSVVIDPMAKGATASLAQAIASADAVVHGRGAVADLLDDADRHAGDAARRRIRCSIDGFGEHGPLASLPARDLLVAAYLGSCADQTGWRSGPSYPVHHVASAGAGLLAVQGVLAAMLVRARTGEGQRVATSLLAAGLAMSGRVEAERPFRDRGLSSRARGTSPLYSVYACSDGRWIQFGCLHAGFVERAIATLGISDAIAPLRSDPGFGDGVAPTTESVRDPFYVAVAAAVLTRPRDAWLAALEAADVPVAPVGPSEAYLDDPQGRANGFTLFGDPVLGRVEAIGPTVRLDGTPATARGGPPRLGQAGPSPLDLDASHRAPGSDDPVRPPDGGGARESGPPRQDGPLTGIVVVEIANVIAGPMTGRYLADLGARVMKLESPDGDIFRQQDVPEFHPLNAGKLGIALDLKSEAGRDVALRLLEGVDVLVNNLRPGAAERLGLGDTVLRDRDPRLVTCQVSAFGASGPYAHRPGGDPLAGAYTGMQAAQGGSGEPVYVRGAPIDHTAALLATAGILLALVARTRTGRGQHVETSLLDAGALLNAAGLVRWPGRPGRDDLATDQYRRSALIGLYEAADGWVALDVETDAEWVAFAGAFGQPAFGLDPRFVDAGARAVNDLALAEIIGDAIRASSVGGWVGAFAHSGVPAAPVLAPGALTLRDPSVTENGWATEVIDPDLGRLRLAHRWLRFSRSSSGCSSAAPRLGGDTARLLAESGISPAVVKDRSQPTSASIGRDRS